MVELLVHLVKYLIQGVFFANYAWVIVNECLKLLVVLTLLVKKVNVIKFISVKLVLEIGNLIVFFVFNHSRFNLISNYVFFVPIKIRIHVHYFNSLNRKRLDEGV